jgi:hypothetical protein
LAGCASIPPPLPKAPPDQTEIKSIINNLSQKANSASTFISSGRVIFKNRAWVSESKSLIIGQREPFQLKIELTHSWGRPILHILIKAGNMKALSFSENRLYSGAYSPSILSKFMPIHPEIDQLWPILRGYPDLKSYDRLSWRDPNYIVLIDQNGRELEKISLDLETLKISSISFPESDLTISFSEYSTEKDIPYAGKIRVDSEGAGKHIVLTHETMVFNREILTNIFTIKIPPTFEIIDLDKMVPQTSADGVMDDGQ